MKFKNDLEVRCESCREVIGLARDSYAIDKYGDYLCHDCHVEAVLVLASHGVKWEGRTVGYTLTEAFGSSLS